MESNLMQIGEIAKFHNISVKAMRVYEKMGIIKPVKVDEQTGYRYYAVDQVPQLNALLDLKHLGFSLLEIKKLLDGGMDNDEFMEALVRKKTNWQEAIAAAEDKIDAIANITRRLSSSEPATKMHELTADERAWLLVKMVCVESSGGQTVLSEAIWL